HQIALLVDASSEMLSLHLAGWQPAASAGHGLRTFPVPLDLPPLDIGMAWHPRNGADPAHRWFRSHVRAAVTGRALT
ncbi:LysR family transcriptional regulator, partial [Streptomyces goshikiensis]